MLLSAAALAASAHAQVIHPNDTAVSAVADTPTLDYEGTTYFCDTGTADGTTGTDQSFLDLELTFSGNCGIAGLGATVTCSEVDPETGAGGARLIALDATTDAATFDLNDGFFCDIAVAGICTISMDGPQDPDDSVSIANLDESADTIDVNVDLFVTRTGSSWCGPTSGTLNLTALYFVTPDNVTVD
jgi:hypothetical protein